MPQLKSRKREAFAREVASMTPLDRAYVLAGYTDSQWARFNASKLAHLSEVAARIEELQDEFADRSGIHKEYLQRRLLPLIEADPRALFEMVDDPVTGRKSERLRPVTSLPAALAAAVTKIRLDSKTGDVVGLDLANKSEVGSVLLRSVGGLVDRVAIDDSGEVADMSDAALYARIVEQSFDILARLGVSPDLLDDLQGEVAKLLGQSEATDADSELDAVAAPTAGLARPAFLQGPRAPVNGKSR